MKRIVKRAFAQALRSPRVRRLARRLVPEPVLMDAIYRAAYSRKSMEAPLIEFLEASDGVDFNKIRELNIKWLKRTPRKVDSVNILTIPISKDPSAGPRQIIELARFLKSKNIEIHFTLFGNFKDDQVSTFRDVLSYYGIGDSKLHLIRKLADVDSLPHASIGIATYWTTAYPLLFVNDVDAKMYYIQDEESRFYPASLDGYFAELTYSFGFIGVTNDSVIRQWYEKNMPCYQVPYTFLRARKRKEINHLKEVKNIFTYYRYFPRNSPELVYEVAKRIKELHPSLKIYFAGAHAPDDRYGISLGWLATEKLLELYEESDICLYFMFNLHSGIIPWECMDAGSIVVTNKKPLQHPYLVHGYNSLIVNPTIGSVVRALDTIIKDEELRKSLIANGYKTVDRYVSEAKALWEKFYEDLTSR